MNNPITSPINKLRIPATAAMLALSCAAAQAEPQAHRSRTTVVEGPRGNTASRTVHVDSWRRPPPPPEYRGPRHGHYYAPGYGYYAVPPTYLNRRWSVGAVVPVPLRRYVVVDLAPYRLPPAPAGLRWVYIGNRIALIRIDSGMIVRLGPVFW